MNQSRNSEVLFVYEAKLCNPNGDPDDENRPRIDPKTSLNLVSDVRLKRFFRDYIKTVYGEKYIWVTTLEGKHVDATQRYEKLSGASRQNKGSKTDDDEVKRNVFSNCIDARLFGAVIPIKAGQSNDSTKGRSIHFTGPVQFTWGYSLHPVELVDSTSITSVFKGRETTEEAGTIGKDWRLYYSLVAFYGVVSGHRMSSTGMTEKDLKILDNLLWVSVSHESTTRSKLGHKPHLYLRVEHDDDIFIGDLRKYVDCSFNPDKPIRSLNDLQLSFSPLVEKLANSESKSSIYLRESDEMRGMLSSRLEAKNLKFHVLPHELELSSESFRT